MEFFIGHFSITKPPTEIKKQDTTIHATAKKAIISRSGDVVLSDVHFDLKQDTFSKTVHPIGGLLMGGGYDLVTKKYDGAIGYELGPIIPIVSTNFSNFRIDCLIHF